KTSIFSHPVYLFLRKFSLQDSRGGSDPRKIVLQWDEMIRTAGSLKLGKVQASVLVRSLLKSERPSGLTQAIIEVGRINKTLYLLNYIDD
ncbi:Tn3 family transposase, partial [Escherichia coli]|nr:Tn3 family transposase [Escherichia coli]